MLARVVRTVFLALASSVAVILALIVLGAFVPAIPAVGIVGSILSGAAGMLGVVLLLATLLAGWTVMRRRTLWRILLLSATALGLVGCIVMYARLIAVGHEYGASAVVFAGTPTASPPDQVVQYSQDEGEPLRIGIWRPAGSADLEAAPVAVFVHGGGWAGGALTDDAPGLKREMADQGWLVLSVGYTFATATRPTWDLAEAQVGCALVWAASNAAHYGADASRLVLLGDSAGGNLALNTAYRARSGTLTPACDGDLPAVDAVAVAYPAVSPYGLYGNPDPTMGPMGRFAISQYIGGSPADYPARYESVASANHIDASSPPTLVIQGENDHLVLATDVYDFVTAAQVAGVNITLVRIPYGEHGFDASPIGSQLYRQITLRWLRDLGVAP
jgi:acetyl esterase/lipase